MDSEKLTPWFPPSERPDRNGVYELSMPPGYGRFSFWNGRFWGNWANTPAGAEYYDCELYIQNIGVRWRGLARKP